MLQHRLTSCKRGGAGARPLLLVCECLKQWFQKHISENFHSHQKKVWNFTIFYTTPCTPKTLGGQSGRSQVSPVSSHDWMRVCFLLSRESASVCLPLLPVCLVFVSSAVKSLCLPLSAFHVAALVLAQVVVLVVITVRQMFDLPLFQCYTVHVCINV